MKRLVLSFSAACLLSVGVARAQEPAAPPVAIVTPPAAGAEAPHQDPWKYQQARDLNDPFLAVRQNAAYKGRQRRERMESRKWYGQSLARPMANPVPHVGGTYSPEWTGNTGVPYEWTGDVIVPSLSVTKRPVKTTLR